MVTQKWYAVSPISREIKAYREEHNYPQEKLAERLNVDPRTIRRWETEANGLHDVRELRRIAECLGIEPERLGVTSLLPASHTPQPVEELLEQVWSLMREGRNYEARSIIEQLLHHLPKQITAEDSPLLLSLGHVYQAGGYIISITSRSNKDTEVFSYFEEAANIARITKDETLLNMALTRYGNALRPTNPVEGMRYLELARDITPAADISVQGNNLRFLARGYLKIGNVPSFERAMGKAEELTHAWKPNQIKNSTRGEYSLRGIYDEYARSYASLRKIDKAFDYLERAEAIQPTTKRSELVLNTTRSMVLIYAGDVKEGVRLASETAQECQENGNLKQLERIYSLRRYLDQQVFEVVKASKSLGKVLDELVEDV